MTGDAATDKLLDGIAHCACRPPRYVRNLRGEWRRAWYEHGRWTSKPIGQREPPCRGCGQVVAGATVAEVGA